MLQITTATGREGPFDAVEETETDFSVTVNGAQAALPKSVIGEGTIGPWVGDPPEPEPEPIPTVAQFEQALDTHFDTIAQADRWDNRFTLMVRAAFPNLWQEKAIAFGMWVDTCNVFAIELLAQVMAGEVAPPPTTEAFLAMLPPAPDLKSQALKGAHS